jgi:hypothetical protein
MLIVSFFIEFTVALVRTISMNFKERESLEMSPCIESSQLDIGDLDVVDDCIETRLAALIGLDDIIKKT